MFILGIIIGSIITFCLYACILVAKYADNRIKENSEK